MNVLALLPALNGGIIRSALAVGYLGRIDTLEAIILIAGVILLVIELFVPGFGIAGGTGVVLLVIGIAMTAGSPLEALALILVLAVLVAGLILLLLRSARKGRIARSIILSLQSSSDKGYRSNDDCSHLVGRTGTALTELRPAGVAEVDGKRHDVVTEGTYIRRGTAIRVIQAIGRRIIVEAIPPKETGNGSMQGNPTGNHNGS